MSEFFSFRAVIKDAGKGGAYVEIPFDVEKTFGKKRVPVKAHIEGIPYRGTLVRMGTPCHLLVVIKEIREKTGKSIGDEVEVALEEDIEPRMVTVPADLQQKFDADPLAAAAFERLSYTHRKEYVRWIEEARRVETRRNRLDRTLEKLRTGTARA